MKTSIKLSNWQKVFGLSMSSGAVERIEWILSRVAMKTLAKLVVRVCG